MKDKLFWNAVLNSDNWGPNYTKISRESKIPISTLFERIKKLRGNKRLQIKIIELSESQALGVQNE